MNSTYGQPLGDVAVAGYEDVILARQKVRELADNIGFSLLDQTRLVTAVSELARNIVVHAGAGRVRIYETAARPGLAILFEDEGPGIADVDRAMKEGFSTAGSLGLGLKGAKKLCDLMSVDSRSGLGTRVEIIKWRR